jgi:hypothetical protein
MSIDYIWDYKPFAYHILPVTFKDKGKEKGQREFGREQYERKP